MTPSTILIVGHGPSLTGAGLGKEIDQYTVCRLKVFSRFHNKEDYGDRTDFICATDSLIAGAVKYCPDAEPWIYFKMGRPKVKPHIEAYMPIEETIVWNRWFQNRCGYIGEGAKGRNYSIGTAAAIIAMGREFKRIVFAGCDTLMDPELEYESVYNPKTVHYLHHLWPVENEMLHLCAEQKGVELCELSRLGVTKATRYTGDGFLKHGLNGPTSP